MQKTHKHRTMIIYRDSVSGRIVTAEYAKRHPSTTTREVRIVHS
jgi:hypothetical protein